MLCNSVSKTPSKCALEMGISKVAVTNWKNRGNIPTDANLQKIANYFNVSVEYLKGEQEQTTKKPLSENEERLKELYELTDGMSDAEIMALKAFVAGLKANRKPE
jgi:transcriptional regulator with XRE-family HTH domain